MATFKGGNGNDTLKGGSAADTLWGLAGNDLLSGFGGNDVLDGGLGNDVMRGGAGNDTYVINSTGDKIDEQGNTDSSDKVRSTVTVNLATLGAGAIEHATLLGTGNINATGNSKNNALTGNSGNNSLVGADGNDTLDGGAGNDKLAGGTGNDRMLGGAGNDTITGGAGNDRIDGGAGNDTIVHSGTGANGDDVLLNFSGGNDTIQFAGADFYDFNWSRDGSDLILGTAADGSYEFDGTIRVAGFFYSEADIAVKIDTQFNTDYGTNADVATIHFTADVTKGIENTTDTEVLIGYYDGNDVINGNGGFYDILFGLGGDDILNGGSGFDHLLGGAGNDTLNGGGDDDILRGDAGVDTFDGGFGIDLLRFNFIPDLEHGVVVDLSQNKVLDDGFGNIETVINVEDVRGSSLDDKLTGSDDHNFLIGDDGNDTLHGGIGDDTLIGGEGNDRMSGDVGRDVFRFASDNGLDTITDYDEFDVLDFSFTELAGQGIAAADLSDFITFDDTGDLDTLLFLDADGSGGNAGTQIANLMTVLSANNAVVRLDGTDFAFNSGTGEFSAVV